MVLTMKISHFYFCSLDFMSNMYNITTFNNPRKSSRIINVWRWLKTWRKNSTLYCKNEEAVFQKLYHLFDKLFTLNRIMIYEMYRIFLFCSSANRFMYILEYVSYKGCNLTWILVDVWRYVCTYIIEIVQKSHKYTSFSDITEIPQNVFVYFCLLRASYIQIENTIENQK